jgi:fatty acid amide hydrolase
LTVGSGDPTAEAAVTAIGIARAVTGGACPPTAPLAEHVVRYGVTHASLNALVQPRHAAARDDAARLAAALGQGQPLPLAGVPVSVKECFGVTGLVTTLGIPARRHAVDLDDAPIVAQLRRAGAVVVGKANVPQAMYLHETDNPVWGRTNHPANPARGPGGSSGGDAALVAAGVVPLAIGTDLAGSVRQPAHACGICGLLPRTASLGDGGAFDTVPSLDAVRPRAGFLARSVADLALALEALADGPPAAELLSGRRAAPTGQGKNFAGPPARNAGRQTADGVPGSSRPLSAVHDREHGPLRVGIWDDSGPLEPSAAIRRAVAEAAATLECAGAEVARIDGSLADEAAWLLLGLLSADGGADIRRLFAGTRPMRPVARLLRLAALPGWVRPGLAQVARWGGRRIEARALLATGPRRGTSLCELLDRIADFSDRFAAFTASHDVLVCPVSALPALPHGLASRLLVAAAPCLLANLLDLAAGVVPITRVRVEEQAGRAPSRDPIVRAAIIADRGSAGLPVGVQVVGLPSRAAPADPWRAEAVVLETMRVLAAAGGGEGAVTERVG